MGNNTIESNPVEDNRDIIVFYHANCSDGFCSAFIANMKFGNSAVYIPLQYKQEIDYVSLKDKQVYFLDFSCKIEQMRDILNHASQVFLLDHHKSSIEDYNTFEHEKLIKVLDNRHSGAYITYKYLFPDSLFVPIVVLYVQDRDLWTKRLHNIEEVSAYIESLNRDFDSWEHLFSEWGKICHNLEASRIDIIEHIHSRYIKDGDAILRNKEILIENILKNKYTVQYEGFKIPCVNSCVYQSEIAGKLAENNLFGLVWFLREDGLIQCSFRSESNNIDSNSNNNNNNPIETDVSNIAKKLGGGGHKHAAGVELSIEAFNKTFARD